MWKPDDDIDGAFKKAKDQVGQAWLDFVNPSSCADRELPLHLDVRTRPLLLKNLPHHIRSLPTPPTRSPRKTLTSPPRPSYSPKRKPWTCRPSSDVTLMHTTSRRSAVPCRAWRRSHIGCMRCWSSLAGTRRWRCCSTRCTLRFC
jgi:hypothetical protein